MLTFIPIYLQSGLGHPSAEAGLMMLPLAPRCSLCRALSRPISPTA
jgi:hypothetical protein